MSTVPLHATDDVLELSESLTYASLPEAAVLKATLAIADTIGCIIAGSPSGVACTVRNVVMAENTGGRCTVFGSPLTACAGTAALTNATTGHALDYDDIAPALSGHASVVLVPTILALAEEVDCGGRALITAYVAGFEAGARLGRWMNPRHYDRGLHATSSLGVIAATVAASRILGLTKAQVRMAIGIAASQSGGLRRNFGTDTKPLHAGLAARAAVLSARLAAAGASADQDILGGEGGFIDVYAGPGAPPARAPGLEFMTSGVTVKLHSSCGATHAGIDAVLDLMTEHSLRPEDVEAIDCRITPWGLAILRYHAPKTPLEGKFSMEYCLAVAALFDRCGPLEFSAEIFRQPAVKEMLARVQVRGDDAMATDPRSGMAQVAIATRGGQVVSKTVDHALGSAQRPVGRCEIRRKFLGCCADAMPATSAEALFAAILDLASDPSVGDVLAYARMGDRIPA